MGRNLTHYVVHNCTNTLVMSHWCVGKTLHLGHTDHLGSLKVTLLGTCQCHVLLSEAKILLRKICLTGLNIIELVIISVSVYHSIYPIKSLKYMPGNGQKIFNTYPLSTSTLCIGDNFSLDIKPQLSN